MTSYGHSYNLSDKLWTQSQSFTSANYEDFEEKAENKEVIFTMFIVILKLAPNPGFYDPITSFKLT